jgi:hypothetical protein
MPQNSEFLTATCPALYAGWQSRGKLGINVYPSVFTAEPLGGEFGWGNLKKTGRVSMLILKYPEKHAEK